MRGGSQPFAVARLSSRSHEPRHRHRIRRARPARLEAAHLRAVRGDPRHATTARRPGGGGAPCATSCFASIRSRRSARPIARASRVPATRRTGRSWRPSASSCPPMPGRWTSARAPARRSVSGRSPTSSSSWPASTARCRCTGSRATAAGCSCPSATPPTAAPPTAAGATCWTRQGLRPGRGGRRHRARLQLRVQPVLRVRPPLDVPALAPRAAGVEIPVDAGETAASRVAATELRRGVRRRCRNLRERSGSEPVIWPAAAAVAAACNKGV